MTPRLSSDKIPLTFSQQWTWNFRELHRRSSTRSVAVATRLLGRLNIHALTDAFSELVRRHESLRTRIVMVNGVPMQQVDQQIPCALEVVDLASLSREHREKDTKRLVDELVHESVDVSIGPLFAARLMKLGESEHVLAISMDHIISDGASIGILLRDVWGLYVRAVGGEPLSGSEVRLQYADYAVWQAKSHASWERRHGNYWRERFAGARPLRLFADRVSVGDEVQIATVPVRIGATPSAKLRELALQQGTSLSMIALSTYVSLLSRWSHETDLVVALVSMGRVHAPVKETIGYFAVTLYLRIEAQPSDSFLVLLARVAREYFSALQHADFGNIAVQRPAPEFITNPRFNWIPGEFGTKPSGAVGDGTVGIEQQPFEIRPRDDFDARGGAPELLLSDSKEGITGVIWYRTDLSTRSTVERFARDFEQLSGQIAELQDASIHAAVVSER